MRWKNHVTQIMIWFCECKLFDIKISAKEKGTKK